MSENQNWDDWAEALESSKSEKQMRTYIVTQVLDWNNRPLKHLVQMRVEANSPSQALSKIGREYKMPKSMFSAILQKVGK